MTSIPRGRLYRALATYAATIALSVAAALADTWPARITLLAATLLAAAWTAQQGGSIARDTQKELQ